MGKHCDGAGLAKAGFARPPANLCFHDSRVFQRASAGGCTRAQGANFSSDRIEQHSKPYLRVGAPSHALAVPQAHRLDSAVARAWFARAVSPRFTLSLRLCHVCCRPSRQDP